jgi:hypothetical protein
MAFLESNYCEFTVVCVINKIYVANSCDNDTATSHLGCRISCKGLESSSFVLYVYSTETSIAVTSILLLKCDTSCSLFINVHAKLHLMVTHLTI